VAEVGIIWQPYYATIKLYIMNIVKNTADKKERREREREALIVSER